MYLKLLASMICFNKHKLRNNLQKIDNIWHFTDSPLSLPFTSNDICSASSERVSSALLPFNERARFILLMPGFSDPGYNHKASSHRAAATSLLVNNLVAAKVCKITKQKMNFDQTSISCLTRDGNAFPPIVNNLRRISVILNTKEIFNGTVVS